ncbi:MAG: ankyrin repeat domain-containing protein, partial [Gammaproteobacteria bacterium]|nr:ankyrin repeat domain-containing protein [Gammaproteobacteria bacterium]
MKKTLMMLNNFFKIKKTNTILGRLILCIGICFIANSVYAAKTKWLDPTPQEKDLMQASMVGDIDTVKSLLEQNVSVDSHGRYGKTALMFAIEEGSDDVAELLIAKGADVNYLTKP